MRKLIEIKQNIQQGQAPDHPFSRDIVWKNGENIVFGEKALRPSAPQISFASKISTEPVTGIAELRILGVRNLFWGTRTGLYRFEEGVGVTDVTNTGGAYACARNQLWTFQPWGNYIYAAYGGIPQIWPVDPGVDDTFEDIDLTGSLFTTAKIAHELAGFPLLLNTDISETDIRWAVNGDITAWAPTAVNSAGGLDIYGLRGPIIAAHPIGIGLGIFSRNEVHILNYIGPPKYFRADHLITGIGTVSAHAVTNVGSTLYGMSTNGFWRSDGAAYIYYDRPDFHRTIYDNINLEKIDLSVVWHNQEEEMVVVFFPSTDSDDVDSAVGYHYRADRLVKLAYSRSAVSRQQVFDRSILGNIHGDLFEQVFVSPGSDFPASPASSGQPLVLPAELFVGPNTISVGHWAYGVFGYGQGGYGDRWRQEA